MSTGQNGGTHPAHLDSGPRSIAHDSQLSISTESRPIVAQTGGAGRPFEDLNTSLITIRRLGLISAAITDKVALCEYKPEAQVA
jgi:hypothetical protein